MKAIIQEVKFTKEWESKYGKMYNFQVKYDNEVALYSSKYKDQKKFIPGQEAEFTEESKTYTDKNGNEKEYKVIKPLMAGNRQSNFGKALNKEKSRYSGFAVSYSKDLVCAGKLPLEDMALHAWTLFELMVEMDKTLES
jgi:hypothetical protein